MLGAIQGATEFLPVSSSAHLVFAQAFLGIHAEGKFLVTFDLALHLGTLLAVIVVMRDDLLRVCKSFLTQANSQNSADILSGRHLGWMLVIATLPAALIGTGLKHFFEALFQDVLWAGIFLCVTGCVLWSTRRVAARNVDFNHLGWKQSLKIGLAQAVAILPGISRSGSTISAGLWSKLQPEQAARFSFLLSTPVILGAFVLEAKNLKYFQVSALWQTLAGMAAAFVVGYASIRWMLKIVGRGQFSHFAIYCWVMGGIAILTQLF